MPVGPRSKDRSRTGCNQLLETVELWCDQLLQSEKNAMREFDNQIRTITSERIIAIEEHLAADVAFFYGPIYPSLESSSGILLRT